MTNSKMITGAAALVALIAVAGIAGVSYAYQGNSSVKGPNYSPERHEAMEKAFEEGDYEAWSELMENRGRVTDVINEDNFGKFAEAHKLAEEGDYKGARQIKEELGLNKGFGPGSFHDKGRGMKGPRMDKETREAVFSALKNGDYKAWQEAMSDRPVADRITEENFEQITEMHNLMQEGKHVEAQEIGNELGLGVMGHGRGIGGGPANCPMAR